MRTLLLAFCLCLPLAGCAATPTTQPARAVLSFDDIPAMRKTFLGLPSAKVREALGPPDSVEAGRGWAWWQYTKPPGKVGPVWVVFHDDVCGDVKR